MDGRSTGKLTSELNDFKVIRKKKTDVLNKFSITAKEDPIAQFHLGAIYYSGDGVEQNYEEAAKWFTKSAQQGYSQAQYNLAAMYEDGEGVKQNIDEALKWYNKSAEQGNKDAIEALKEFGYEINNSLKQDTDKLYENRIITLQDNEDQGSMEESIDLYNLGIQEYNQKKFFKALNFFTKSAELGNSLAQYYLGRMYAEGQAVKQDFEEAKKWYKTSSLNGCEVAKKALKNIEINIKNNIPTIKQDKLTFQEDKNQGDVDLYNLGLQDYKQKRFFKALNSFTKSAELGNPLSQYYLGVMYSEGKAVKQDIEEAKKWFRKSSEQGNQDSLKALKKLSTEIKKNPVTSEEQYQFASDYYKEKIYSEAFKWFTKSADQGNNNALYYLGIMYQKGEGVGKNFDEAKKYYKKSSLGGCLEAKTALEELENNIKDGSNINNTKKENVKIQQEESKKISQNKESVELYNLGVQDYKQKRFFKALNYFTKSAEMGNPLAQYYLGIMYAQGKSVKPDIGEAKKWFQKSSLTGCKEAQKALDKLENIKVKEPVNEKKEETQKVVSVSLKKDTYPPQEYKTNSDDTTALYSQKKILVNLEKNTEAKDDNKKEAKNDIELYSLGLKYYDELNYEKAFNCFMELAKKDDSQAQYNIGVMYENGEGVELNIEDSKKWYRKSAENGDDDAKKVLQELELIKSQYKEKESIIIYNLGMKDYREGYYSDAFNKFLNSAKLGNSQAQYNLGVMYENGEGVEVNIEKAKKWYSKALENGDNEASDVLAELNGYKSKNYESSQQLNIPNFSNIKCDGLIEFLRNISNFIARKAGNLAGAIVYSTPDDRRKWLRNTKIICFLVSILWTFILVVAGQRGAFYTGGEVSLGVIFTFPDPEMNPFLRIFLNLFIVVGLFTGGIVEIFKSAKTGWNIGYSLGKIVALESNRDTWPWLVGAFCGVICALIALSFAITFICIPFGISAFKKED